MAPIGQAVLVAPLQPAGIRCRGASRPGFHLLPGHSRPAFLIECGFLTSPSEAHNLHASACPAKIAEANATGIAAHLSGQLGVRLTSGELAGVRGVRKTDGQGGSAEPALTEV